MSGELGPGSRRDVQHAAEAVAVFGRESTGQQVHGLEDLRAHAGRKLRLRVIQEGYSVDELVQREFGSADGQKIVVAVAGPRHQIVDEVVRALQHRLRQPLEVLPREGVRTPGFLRIDGQVVGLNLDTLPHGLFFLQIHVERNRLTRAQHKLVSSLEVARSLHSQCVRPAFHA